jgi:hypothetical protein
MPNLEFERLDKIEQHLKLLKEDSILKGYALTRIETAIIGNPLNDNWGMVHDIKDIKKRVEILEIEKIELKPYKIVFGIIAATIITGLVAIFVQSIYNGEKLKHVDKIEINK